MSTIVSTHGLTRRFGDLTAVDRLDLVVPAEGVYAFLGPNGAGKTTTIRLLLGLLRPDAGEIHVGGRRLRRGDVEPLRQIGALIETPSLYPHLTGRENLEITRRLIEAPAARVGEVLRRVGLSDAADRPVRGYSTGMRQRLGLALALVGEPRLLVLDEPTNGLDPSGIQEIRDLIRRIPRELGTTVFLSSHLLGEVEQVATSVGIIARGALLYQGALEDLRRRSEEHLRVEVDRPADARTLLEKEGWEVTGGQGGALRVAARGKGQAATINAALVGAGYRVSQLSRRGHGLEDLFLRLTAAGETAGRAGG